MAEVQKVALSWSGGKDSALSFFELQSPKYQVVELLTSFTGPDKRVQMHDIREELIQAQAKSLGVRLKSIYLPENPSNEIYEEKFQAAFEELKKEGIKHVGFGDLFLDDIKEYRDMLLAQKKIEGLYPLWGWESQMVQNAFHGLKMKAIVHCVNLEILPASFLGREYNKDFITDLPPGIDPSGENGEFHSFVYGGLFFEEEIPLEQGEKYEKGQFAFQDLKLKA